MAYYGDLSSRERENEIRIIFNSPPRMPLQTKLQGEGIKCLPLTELLWSQSGSAVKKQISHLSAKFAGHLGTRRHVQGCRDPVVVRGTGYFRRGCPSRSEGVAIPASPAKVGAMSTVLTGPWKTPVSTPVP